MPIDITKLTLEEILDLKAQLDRIKIGTNGRTRVQSEPAPPRILSEKEKEWETWDWSKSNIELAREHEHSQSYISIIRSRMKKPRAIRGRPEKVRYEALDWTKPNKVLAAEQNVSIPTICGWRHRLGKPKVTKWWPKCLEWDWTKSNEQIMRETGADYGVVQKLRIRCGNLPNPKKEWHHSAISLPPSSDKPDMWAGVDWENTIDAEIARCVGVSRERVRQMRNKLNKPKCYLGDLKIRALEKEFPGRKRLSFNEAIKKVPNMSPQGFAIYCKKLGIEVEKTITIRAKQKTPWHLVNWALPTQLLAEIWKRKYGVVANCRSYGGRPPPLFGRRQGASQTVMPKFAKELIEAEKQKAQKWFEEHENNKDSNDIEGKDKESVAKIPTTVGRDLEGRSALPEGQD